MNLLIRWGKFNAVGAMGVLVQLAALAAINRLWPGHYLWATAAAIEITLLHNFAWHLRWTWRDRTSRHETRPDQTWRHETQRDRTPPHQTSPDQSSPDRFGRESAASHCWRFHLSNGLVSMLGNLALMRLMVDGAHVPLLAANAIAILTCSLLNFCLADRWAFSANPRTLGA
jgi:putative flippase GtrA